jgi:hypothetical protein
VLLRSTRLDGAGVTPLDPIGVFDDGSLLHLQQPQEESVPASEISVAWRLDRTGKVAVKLAELINPLPLRVPHKDHLFTARDPFAGSMEIVLDPTGRFLYRVDGTATRDAERGAILIDRLDPNGVRLWRKTFTYVPQRVPDSILMNFTHALPDAARKLYARTAHFLPGTTSIIAGTDGTLFLARDLEHRTWEIVRSDGTAVGRFVIQEGAVLLGGQSDHVWIADERDPGFRVSRYRISER